MDSLVTSSIDINATTGDIYCQGRWVLSELNKISAAIQQLRFSFSSPVRHLKLHGEGLSYLDSSGAWLIYQLKSLLKDQGYTFELVNFPDGTIELIRMVDAQLSRQSAESVVQHAASYSLISTLGYHSVLVYNALTSYFEWIGALTLNIFQFYLHKHLLRIEPFTIILYRSGFQALPIIALLSLMIGVVITYQMGLQLKLYGANIFIVDLLGLSVLREFAPLLTAIMVAGRTGSAFTAELGMMKINREIDALSVMGVSTVNLLIVPRIFALVIALPLLTVWAECFGVMGGMFMSKATLDITPYDFINRFSHVIPLKAFIIGIAKAPIFALVISTIACYQGFTVRDNADSVGKKTTSSVVAAIFFIILADALFSILFSWFKL